MRGGGVVEGDLRDLVCGGGVGRLGIGEEGGEVWIVKVWASCGLLRWGLWWWFWKLEVKG